jgi:hypothetical protein
MQGPSSVGDPDPKVPHIFGPPGSESGSISQRSGSFLFLNNACKTGFWHKILAKKIYFKNEDNVLFLSYKKKIWRKKNIFLAYLKLLMKEVGSRVGSGSISQRYGSPGPDPHQKVTDAQHWGQES